MQKIPSSKDPISNYLVLKNNENQISFQGETETIRDFIVLHNSNLKWNYE